MVSMKGIFLRTKTHFLDDPWHWWTLSFSGILGGKLVSFHRQLGSPIPTHPRSSTHSPCL